MLSWVKAKIANHYYLFWNWDDINLTFCFQSSSVFRLSAVDSNNYKMDVTLRANVRHNIFKLLLRQQQQQIDTLIDRHDINQHPSSFRYTDDRKYTVAIYYFSLYNYLSQWPVHENTDRKQWKHSEGGPCSVMMKKKTNDRRLSLLPHPFISL